VEGRAAAMGENRLAELDRMACLSIAGRRSDAIFGVYVVSLIKVSSLSTRDGGYGGQDYLEELSTTEVARTMEHQSSPPPWPDLLDRLAPW
jgi:hypothetical protein